LATRRKLNLDALVRVAACNLRDGRNSEERREK
jgi:hypothetical protein